MRHQWIHKQGNERLIVYFNGWGMNETSIRHLDAEGYDVLMFYAYHDTEPFDKSLLNGYLRRTLIAWSMGVWCASELYERIGPDISIAVNGTPSPVDDRKGIPVEIFKGTLDGLSEHTLDKFMLRTSGTRDTFDRLNREQNRSYEDRRAELQWWMDNYRTVDDYYWDFALIGSHDKIISEANQLNAWEGHCGKIIRTDMHHYPFARVGSWQQIIDLCER